MSGSIGGASFDLSVGRERFGEELNQAIDQARRAAEQIQRILGGAGVPQSGGTAAAAQGITAVGTAAAQTNTEVAGLATTARQAETDWTRLTEAVRAAGTAQTQVAASSAAATTEIIQSREAQAAAVVATGRRIVDQFDAEQRAQRALNTIRTAAGRENIQTGRADVSAALVSSENALSSVRARDLTAAFDSLTRAEGQARSGLTAINAELTRMAASSGQISNLARVVAEIERLSSTGTPVPGALFDEFQALTDAAGEEGESFNRLNQQAKTLTAALDQLAVAQREAAGQGAAAARAAREQAAALRVQAQTATDLARSALVTTTQTALGADPTAFDAVSTKDTLLALGLNAREATHAVTGLQNAVTSIGRSQSIKELQIGFANGEVAAKGLDAAMRALAAGDTDRGIAELNTALTAMRRALVEANTAAQQLRRTMQATGTEAEQQQLRELNARRQNLQSAINAAERSVGGLEGPETRRLKQVEIEQKRAINDLDREAIRIDRERGVVLARNATALQNLVGAANQGAFGRVVGGLGRAAASLEAAGFTASTAAALGLVGAITALTSAILGAAQAGIAFNATMEVSAVRLTAARGSAGRAVEEINRLKTLSTSQTFGNFGTEDLALGLEKLQRISQDTPKRLQQIADVAAGTGQTFLTTATQIGIFYERLGSGLPLDDTLQGLINAGILTAAFAAQLRQADIAGASAAEKVQIFETAITKFNGTANRLGETGTGSFQRFRNELGILFGAATESSFNDLADALKKITDALDDPGLERGTRFLTEAAKILLLPAPTAGGWIATGIRAIAGAATGNDFNAPSARERARDTANPPAPAQDSLLADRAGRQLAAYQAGQAAVRAYVSGFDDAASGEFATLDDMVRTHLEALSGGKLSGALEQTFNSVIEPLLAKAVTEIQRYGKVGEDTALGITVALGVEGDAVLKLIDLYGKLRAATAAVAQAQASLDAAQTQADYGQTVAASILRLDQEAIDAAQDIKRAHEDAFDTIIQQQREVAQRWSDIGNRAHATFQQQIDDLDKEIRARSRANQQAAQDAQDAIQSLADDLSGYQDTVDRRRQDAQDAIDAMRKNVQAIQGEVQQAQQAQSQHQAAYQAVLAGTIDLFNQEHQQQDDITRAIIQKWDAEISGARRAKDEADHRVRAQTVAENLLTLAYDKRIAAARAAGREDQARALERERDRVLAAQRQAGQVDRDEAAVAADRLGDRTRDAEAEAKRTGSSDQVAVNNAQSRADAAQKELDAAEELEQARQRAEDEEVKRRQAAIEAAQRAEQTRARNAAAELQSLEDQRDAIVLAQKESDKYYKDIIDNINNKVIPALQAQKREQQAADQQKIDDAKTIFEADKKYFDQRKIEDQAIVDAARDILEKAKLTLSEYDKQVSSLKLINAQLDQMVLKAQVYLNALRQAAGLGPLPVGLPSGDPNPYPNDPPIGGRTSGPVNTAGTSFPVVGVTTPVSPHGGTQRGGADIFAASGTPVVALADGVITSAGYDTLGGNTVTLRTDSGLYVYMAHLRDRAAVTVGQRVKAGEFLGYVGNTGNATGGPPHLHIGIANSPGGFTQGAGAAGGTGDADAVGILNGAQSGQPAPKPSGAKPPLIDGTGKSVIPDGYHAERELATQTIWFVPDDYTLADYGKKPAPATTPTPTPTPTPSPGGGSGGGGGKNLVAGDYEYQRAALPLPRVPSDYPNINIDALATAHAIGGSLATRIDTGTPTGAGMMSFGGHLLNIERVDAANMQQVEAMIDRVEQRLLGMHFSGFDAMKRGGVVLGNRR